MSGTFPRLLAEGLSCMFNWEPWIELSICSMQRLQHSIDLDYAESTVPD